MKQTETNLIKACMEYLAVKKFKLFWRNNTGAFKTEKGFYRFGEVGSADIFVVLPPYGKLIGIECKVGRNRLNESQIIFGKKLVKAGGVYIVCRSLDDLIRELEN